MLYDLIATSTFGLEATVKRQLNNLGFDNLEVSDGSIGFKGTLEDIARTNIHLRTSDRILLVMGKFKATTFEELFEGTKKINWQDIIPEKGNFIITGKSIKSTLFSVPDCQSIVEKAIVEKLKTKYNVNWFEKSGPIYKIQVALLKDIVTLTIDTTGPSLHKRGYRENSVIAPLKETLAASLIDLSFWNKDRVLLDPFCGSGTIPIEAALMAKNIAPGISRTFVCEQWDIFNKDIFKKVRKDAFSRIDVNFRPEIYASDIDPKAIETAKHNAYLAGVDDCIRFECKDFNDVYLTQKNGICICNPPYAERIGEGREVTYLYKKIGKVFNCHRDWSLFLITPNEEFESLFGRKADKKRKLFNGNIKIDYYQYYGEKPKK